MPEFFTAIFKTFPLICLELTHMKTTFISSQVRPIKKLFVIDIDGFAAFERILKDIQTDVDVAQNLLMVNDEDLWSEPTKEFIKRSDPDIILNLSSLSDHKLSMHFDIFSMVPEKQGYDIRRYVTALMSFTRKPAYLDFFGADLTEEILLLSGKKFSNDAFSMLCCINYGLFEEEEQSNLNLSIFKTIHPKYLENVDEALDSLFDSHNKFNKFTDQIGSFGGSGFGSGLYFKDYNHEGLFGNSKKYLIISKANDLKSICYYWNSRSYFYSTDLAWIPVDYINELSRIIDETTVFVCLDEALVPEIKGRFEHHKLLTPTRLHFSGRHERWTFLRHQQPLIIVDNEPIIHHPVEKTFSEVSSSAAFMLEVRGLQETLYPKRRNFGHLFAYINEFQQAFPEEIIRLSERGLAKYVFHFSPTQAEDVTVGIILPDFEKAVEHLFAEAEFDIKKTVKTSILDQTVRLIGSLEELEVITDRNIFELLIALTPKFRSERVAKDIAKKLSELMTSDQLSDIVSQFTSKGAMVLPSVTLTMEGILDLVKIEKKQKKYLHPILQRLHDHKVLLRGKYFNCPHCNSNLWIPISELKRVNYCIECGNQAHLPVFSNDRQDSDHYRLNQLLARAVDQGQLSTLLPLVFFFKQGYGAFEYISNIDVFRFTDRITDVDLFIKIGRRIGVVECKSTNKFTTEQVDDLLGIAVALKCDFAAFTCISDASSEIVRDLSEMIKLNTVNFPVFIVSKNALFEPAKHQIDKYFKLERGVSDFPIGPIIV